MIVEVPERASMEFGVLTPDGIPSNNTLTLKDPLLEFRNPLTRSLFGNKGFVDRVTVRGTELIKKIHLGGGGSRRNKDRDCADCRIGKIHPFCKNNLFPGRINFLPTLSMFKAISF